MRRPKTIDLFARRLRSRRERRGWTQSELASRAGVPTSVVQRLERGARVDRDADVLRRLASAFAESAAAFAHGTEWEDAGDQLALFPDQAGAALRRAHYACALTLAGTEARDRLEADGRVLRSVCRSRQVELYDPSDHSDPGRHPELRPQEVFATERRQIISSDLFILHCEAPSFGAGQELQIAAAAGVPIVLVVPEGRAVSRMVLGNPGACWEVRFGNVGELRVRFAEVLDDVLAKDRRVRPALELGLGARVTELREAAGLQRWQVAEAVGCSPTWVAQLEERGEAECNPSLAQLQALAGALGTSLVYLVSGRLMPLEAEFEAVRDSFANLRDHARLVGLKTDEEERLREAYMRSHRGAIEQRQTDLLAVWGPEDWAPLVHEVLRDRKGSYRRLDLEAEQRLAAMDVEYDERMG